ncbi:MAG TPA: hypothetical protein VMU75_02550 [Acidimicrobiales bacterium]|nr:hypothetical protein [Acidimicrobiales bacterium]
MIPTSAERISTARSDEHDQAPASGGTRSTVLAVAALAACLIGVVILLYAAAAHVASGNSDGATVVLEGQSLSSGNLSLHGWSLSRDSFWSVDALFYLFAVLGQGVRSSQLDSVPAVIAALVVVVGAVLARGSRRGGAGIAAMVTVFTLLALPSRAMSMFLLQGPLHVGTALWALVAFAGLRSGRFGWGWIVAVVLLAAGLLGDLQIAVFGVAPAALAGLAAMARRRNWRSGLASLSAAAASVALAFVIREVADLVGTFGINPVNPTASPSQMLANLADIWRYGPALLGIDAGPYGATGVPAALRAVHVIGLVVIVAGVLVALGALLHGSVAGRPGRLTTDRDWHVDDLLLFAFLGDLGVFARLDEVGVDVFARYLTAAVIFGAVLGGRLVGRVGERLAQPVARRGALVAGISGVLAYGAALGLSFRLPSAGQTPRQLAAFLADHRLTKGLGDYWSASIVTVASNAEVVVRPVIDGPSGRVVRYERQSDASWYTGQRFQFILFNAALPLVSASVAAGTFGPPTTMYSFGDYRVLVFKHPISVSSIGTST